MVIPFKNLNKLFLLYRIIHILSLNLQPDSAASALRSIDSEQNTGYTEITMGTGAYITVIGGSNVDITGLPDSRFSPGDSNPGRISMTAGGVGRNIAENTARLGIRTELLTAIAGDSFGDFLMRECSEANIGMGNAAVLSGAATSVYNSIMDERGELRAAVSDMEITEEITSGYLLKNKELIQRSDIVITDNNISGEALTELIGLREGRILFDAVSGIKLKKRADLVRGMDTVKLNDIEAEILSGIRIETPEDASEASEIISKRGISHIFITLGAAGALYSCGAGRWFLSPKSVTSVNTTGCGDAFMAGIAWGRLQGRSGRELLRCATACAEIAAASSLTVSREMSCAALEKKLEGE